MSKPLRISTPIFSPGPTKRHAQINLERASPSLQKTRIPFILGGTQDAHKYLFIGEAFAENFTYWDVQALNFADREVILVYRYF